jgi:uncharacterized protein YlzI (FlbEa/FlbD family)
MLIELTDVAGNPVWINTAFVTHLEPTKDPEGTRINFVGGYGVVVSRDGQTNCDEIARHGGDQRAMQSAMG